MRYIVKAYKQTEDGEEQIVPGHETRWRTREEAEEFMDLIIESRPNNRYEMCEVNTND